MLGFLANVIEQLDVALEHLTKCDANNARFGLMLTDNIVELMLHQIAKDKKNELKMFSYMREEFKHTAALEKALGRPFESKVKFAKVLGTFLDEIAESRLRPRRQPDSLPPLGALVEHNRHPFAVRCPVAAAS
jgi:hypothetical protein